MNKIAQEAKSKMMVASVVGLSSLLIMLFVLSGFARAVCRSVCVHRSQFVLYVGLGWATGPKPLSSRPSSNHLWHPARDVELRCV